ncbi:MAG: hypothetical protein ABW178_09110 [Pseudoxanthomonas sp.]
MIALLALPLHAWAQTEGKADLKRQMSPAEFKAAGLDRLNASELSALNAWLDSSRNAPTNAVVTVAAAAPAVPAAALMPEALERAREEGRQEVIQKNRGFFDFGSSEPIASLLVGEFRGFGKGRRYILANGQEWEQTDATTLSGVRRTDPAVTIKPGVIGTVWYMRIDGYNTAAKVQRIK